MGLSHIGSMIWVQGLTGFNGLRLPGLGTPGLSPKTSGRAAATIVLWQYTVVW